MADTIITNTPGVTRSVDDGSSAIGWVVALLVVLALIVGGVVLYLSSYGGIATPAPSTDINSTLPAGGANSTGSAGAATY